MNLFELLNDLLIPIIVTIGIIVIGLYLVSYLTRLIKYLKIKESPILGDEAFSILEIIFLYTLFSFLFIIIILSYAFSMHLLAQYTTKIIFPYFNMFFLIMMIFLFSFLFLTINSRLFRYLRGELHIKPKNIWSYKLSSYMELFIKYLIYSLTTIFILIVILSSFGILKNTVEGIYSFSSKNIDGFITMFILLLGGILTYLFINAYLKDIKLKSRANKDKLLLYISGILKHFISSIIIVGIILIFLSMIGFTYADVFVFIVFIIFLIFSFSIIFTPPLINALAGLSILISETFVIGNYIKIDDINFIGEIIDIKIMNTVLRDHRGNIIYVPNSKMMNYSVTNIGIHEKIIPVKIELLTEKNVDKDFIEECILKEKINDHIIYNNKPKVYLQKIENNKKIYEILVYIDDIGKIDDVKTDILEKLYLCMMNK
ncbi:MAG: mechanosensitive ion channel domain-containing protein [Thermoplasmata archaeon]